MKVLMTETRVVRGRSSSFTYTGGQTYVVADDRGREFIAAGAATEVEEALPEIDAADSDLDELEV